jgi:hypothetical protein
MTKNEVIALDHVQSRIFILRGHRVLLDTDLAAFYGVPTKSLNQALKRNADRFPVDFCFQLTSEESDGPMHGRKIGFNPGNQQPGGRPSIYR